MDIAPTYDAKLFVSPGEAYQRVLSKAQRWKDAWSKKRVQDRIWTARHLSLQTAPGDQVLDLVGERGGGKTWLLRYLSEDDRHVSPQAVYLDLAERTNFSKPEQYVKAVQEKVQKQLGNERAILLLDTLPPYLDEHLRALEKDVLWPHLTQRGSLLVMALVHPLRVCWRMPTLRGAERCSLQPFDESQTREQLDRLRKAKRVKKGVKASHVHEASGGLPLLNFLLATRDRIQPWEALLEYWLASVRPDDRDRVQTYLEIVCTLDTLEQAKIEKALKAYRCHQPDVGGYRTHPGDVRNTLRQHWLARSMPESPGKIVLVDSIRRATREVLQARDGELYAALEEVA